MGAKLGRGSGHRAGLGERGPRPSHDAIGEVLEAIVELGGDGTHAAVHHLLDEQLQLLFRHVHVKPLLQVADGARAVETGELRPCREGGTGFGAGRGGWDWGEHSPQGLDGFHPAWLSLALRLVCDTGISR